MVPEMEKPRITEVLVRMDCNGCVQKIKKALHGIPGIKDIYIDFPQQKLTIIGWADPEKIVKAIKKTRKSAVISLLTEQPTPEGEGPTPEPASSPEPPKPEPPKEQPLPENPPPPENPTPPENPSPEIAIDAPSQTGQKPPEPRDQEEIHVVHHHPPDPGYRHAYGPNFQQEYNGQRNSYNMSQQIRDRPPIDVTHSYNTYQPSPYVTEYAHPQSIPRYSRYSEPEYNTRYNAPEYNTRYNAPEHNTRYNAPEYNIRYSEPEYNTRMSDYYSSQDYYSGTNGNGNITSMFSEENPNACRIV